MGPNNSEETIQTGSGQKVQRKPGFQPGHKKVGGRKKGIPTRTTWMARALAEQRDFNPLDVAISVVMKGILPGDPPRAVSTDERLKALRDVMQYLLPKLSAVQMTGSDGGPVKVASLDVTQLMANPELAAAAQMLALGMAAAPVLEPEDDTTGQE